MISFSLSVRFSLLSVIGSPSTTLVAAYREGSPASLTSFSMMCAMECTARCTSPWQRSNPRGRSFCCAASIVRWTSSSQPSFFAAEMGTMGSPRFCERSGTSMESPFCRTSSIMLSATTTGTPTSMSCSVK